MRQPVQPGLTAEEAAARRGRSIKFAVRRKRGVWEGTVVLPIGMHLPGAVPSERVMARRFKGLPRELPAGAVTRSHGARAAVTARHTDKGSAIANAAGLASQIASNPLVAAALPPGSGAAIKALEIIGKNAPLGKLDDALKKLTGAGAGRIVNALKFW